MISLKNKNIAKMTNGNKKFDILIKDILTFFNWQESDFDCLIELTIDPTPPEGGGRVEHFDNKHIIRLNPRLEKPFPWRTVQHETIHSLMKEKVKDQFEEYKFDLPIDKTRNYAEQSFRDNLEEYVVRVVNALILAKDEGDDWYDEQIQFEATQDFTLAKEVSDFLTDWKKERTPFTEMTFIDLIKKLTSK